MKRKSVSILFGVLVAVLAAVIIILVCSIRGSAETVESGPKEARYSRVEVRPGDTLWAISEEYAEGSGFEVREYLSELKRINRLQSDRINVGMSLIVVRYE